METVRLRLVFESSLTKCQKIEGLQRCWILLKPEHQTISDISSYILSIFDLHKECSKGILLSMEGFVLPPFESTSIFKDKDIIRVKRMGGGSTDMILVDDGVKSLEVVELVNTQPVPTTGMNLLANEEFDKESGGYKSESEDDDSVPEKEEENVESSPEPERVSKKRKASGEQHNSKKKKKKSATAENFHIGPESVGNDIHTRQNETLTTPTVVERKKKGGKAMAQAKSSSQPKENGNGNADADAPNSPGGSKKPSRSARRKKLKRQWLKEQRKAEQKEQQQRQLIEKISLQPSGKAVHRVSENGAQKDCQENSKCEEDHQSQSEDNSQDVVVPITIKPGHIRFGSSKEVAVDQAKQQDQIPVNPFQWSGVTSKRKGQKWGTEKGDPDKRKRHEKFSQDYSEMIAAEKQTHDESNNYTNFSQESPNIVAADEDSPENGQINYDELPLLASLPKEGDVIAYRVIELSSSWTPETSSYRVGRVSWYDPQSNRIIIVPVPGYPVIERENDECSGIQSLYGEDGSLEADYSSLLEVRSMEKGCLKSEKSVSKEVKQVLVQNQDAGTCLKTTSNKEAPASVQEKREVSGWEEIQQALSAKKAKLSVEDSGSKAESSGRNPWSFKAMRSSALGPTMALLRAQDKL